MLRAAAIVALLAASSQAQSSVANFTPSEYAKMSARILAALRLAPGERVLIPRDPGYFDGLIPLLEAGVRRAKAVPALTEWTRKGARREGAPIAELLNSTDVFLWLPFRTTEREVTPEENRAIARWTDQGGSRRQVHFHWDQGSVLADGLMGPHSAELDRVMIAALEVNVPAMAAAQRRAEQMLRAGKVRVATKAGTDITFEIRDRPFNRQDGVATGLRMRSAKVRVDREIELPAGVLRVAPIEETANGTIVVPEARFGGKIVKGLRLTFTNGKITSMIANEGLAAVQNELTAAGDAALRFREFGLGFNPKLVAPPSSKILPYFAYGAGMVRMSLGDNEELGGAIRGGYRRWFFFPDASVEVNGKFLTDQGRLLVR